ncbi:prostaglandin reductase 3 [Trichonephila inaurata madagascariensis]|uniref:15-oxoprostaglandin 13-reductase n=1 Tax=Trichonephila inaurata madagascariensis TaxID=2747483 RepID=A0A8X7CRL7_9ARAC|nr:prostaglandin reductase 3 [Trichonephila inaurata madagascariensis]
MASKPKTFKKLMVQKLTSNFREAVSVENVEMCHPRKGEICVRNKFVGVNPKGDGVGEIVEVGEKVENLQVGATVAYMHSGRSAYAECLGARITTGDTVLITAAAGGTGHIAVQWAKATGCHVIGTCSSEEKEKMLKGLGCDRIINYRKEDLGEVLAKEYPKGVDAVWETIGGKVLEECLKHLAIKGRLLIVGGISGYKTENKEVFAKLDLSNLPEQLLFKSAAVQGFFLPAYADSKIPYFKYLSKSLEAGKLKIIYDNGEKTAGTEFFGVEGIIEGVEHLHSGRNIGKVVVRMS